MRASRSGVARRMAANHDASDATPAVLDFQLHIRDPATPDEAAELIDTDADPAIVAGRCDALVARWAQ